MSMPLPFLRPATLRLFKSAASSPRAATPRNYVKAASTTYSQRRFQSDKARGPTQDQLPHVSEEAAKTSEIMGETPVEIEEVGTPVKEMLERDGGIDKAPEVLKQEISNNVSTPSASAVTASPSASSTPATPESALEYYDPDAFTTVEKILEGATPVVKASVASQLKSKVVGKGGKLETLAYPPLLPPMPPLPLPANHHIQHRYNPLLEQIIPLFQRDGKKARAQTVVQQILRILRTKPVPDPSPKHLLVPTSPPPESLPGNPIAYLQTAIDSLAPLLKMRNQPGSGGSTVQIPFPIPVRQRRRRAVEWMMESADKKKDRLGLAERFANEVVDVVEGRSLAWDKRTFLHRQAIVNRSNVDLKRMKKR